MDHHLMHHADMDMGHGGHGGHGDMDMGQCNMNMLFTWSTKNLCIVFPQWRVTGAFSLFVSLVVIVLLTAGYEGIRHATRVYEARQKQRLGVFGATNVTGNNNIADESATATVSAGLPASSAPHLSPSQATHDHVQYVPDESSPLLAVGRDQRRVVERRGKIIMAALYAVQVFYSFFVMLLFMTYNGFVMLAVAVGAFVGYLVFGQDTSAAKTVACH